MLQVKVCEYYCWNSMHKENAKYWFAIKIVLEPERNNIEEIPVNLSLSKSTSATRNSKPFNFRVSFVS